MAEAGLAITVLVECVRRTRSACGVKTPDEGGDACPRDRPAARLHSAGDDLSAEGTDRRHPALDGRAGGGDQGQQIGAGGQPTAAREMIAPTRDRLSNEHRLGTIHIQRPLHGGAWRGNARRLRVRIVALVVSRPTRRPRHHRRRIEKLSPTRGGRGYGRSSIHPDAALAKLSEELWTFDLVALPRQAAVGDRLTR